MLSLYRRHRPRTFDDVVGQEHIVRTLRNAIELDKVHHAYLFVGSRGTGKTSTAKLLACALNAEGGPRVDFSPDDPACAAIRDGTSLDVVEMDAASNNSVDDIRELRENIGLSPMGGARRVYILDEAHMLSTAAWNAFLKTLEEPPSHVVFVLATTEAHKVPATIVDRCHRFDFHRASLEQIAGVLRHVAAEEGIELPDAAAGMIARAATGSFRDALATLEQLVTYGGAQLDLDDVLAVLGVADAEHVLEAAESIAEHDPKRALMAVEVLSSSGRDTVQFIHDLAAHLRHLFVVQTLGEVPDSFSVTAEHTDRLAAQAQRTDRGEILRAIDLLASSLGAIKDGAEPRIQLELALLKALQPEADLSVKALMLRIERLEQRLAGAPAPASRDAGPEQAAGAQHEREAGGAEPMRAGDIEPMRAGEARPSEHEGAGGSAPGNGQPRTAAPPAPEPTAGPVTSATPEPAAVSARSSASDPSPGPSVPPLSSSASDPSRQFAPASGSSTAPAAADAHAQVAAAPAALGDEAIDVDRLNELWPAAVEAVRLENQMVGALLGEARPTALEHGRLTITFPAASAFSRKKAEANSVLLGRALAGLTGAKLTLVYELGGEGDVPAQAPGLSEEQLLARLRDEFGARELTEETAEASGEATVDADTESAADPPEHPSGED